MSTKTKTPIADSANDAAPTAKDGDEQRIDAPESTTDTQEQPDADIVRSASPVQASTPSTDILYYAPFTRVNEEKREVIGVATAEVKDAYRTVIGYEASKDALTRWVGNIREMHRNIAAGSALDVIPDDEGRRVLVRAYISKGAEDTWQKVLDKTLRGFSIGGKNGKWTTRIIDGEELPYLERYDAVELSLVDNPACPGCTIEVVRADGMACNILAEDEEMPIEPTGGDVAPPDDTAAIQAALTAAFTRSEPGETPDDIERVGAKHSKSTMSAMHDVRNHQLLGAVKSMQACGCDECMTACKVLDPDNDGDIDLAGLYDPDDGTPSRAQMAQLTRDLKAHIESQVQGAMTLIIQRVESLAPSDAHESPEITRRVDGLDAQLGKIYALVEKIADQPVDGGPVLHGGVPVDKRLVTQGPRTMNDAEVLRRALELGFTAPSTQEQQIFAASTLMPRPR